MTHQHEAWQIRRDEDGLYCAACGDHLASDEHAKWCMTNKGCNCAPVTEGVRK